ncbi:Uncharacterised protein [Klebsiella pneumoniae]|nr:Uncharacterised protein [Klebsiella pneumoniae]VGB25187.1 Uncharacterised protein [Klebsiella pneumoniae]VGB74118.1 Uncharacterised protein [Klebsiella pneumoniae]
MFLTMVKPNTQLHNPQSGELRVRAENMVWD